MEREEEFWNIVNSENIDMSSLHKYEQQNLPENTSIRFYYWLLCFKVIPKSKSKWKIAIQTNTENYLVLIQKHLKEINIFDFKISEDCGDQLLFDINSDILRTSVSSEYLHSFLDDSDFQNSVKRIIRILYILSKEDDNCIYTQGFNEIIIPIYIVSFLGCTSESFDLNTTEALAFYMIKSLLIDLNLNSIYCNIDKPDRLTETFKFVNSSIREIDPKFAEFFIDICKIEPIHYSFPWVTTMFTQVIDINDIFRLWDHIIILGKNATKFAMAMASAAVLFQKKQILQLKPDKILLLLHREQHLKYMPLLRIASIIYERMCDKSCNEK